MRDPAFRLRTRRRRGEAVLEVFLGACAVVVTASTVNVSSRGSPGTLTRLARMHPLPVARSVNVASKAAVVIDWDCTPEHPKTYSPAAGTVGWPG